MLAASTRSGEDDGDQDPRKRDRVGRLSGLDGRPGRRVPVRQRRHRLRADDRGAREGPGAPAAASQARHLPPREHRPAHGDRLLPRHRAAPAHHASRQRGHGQRDERALERSARTGADALHRGPHAHQRGHAEGPSDARHPLDAGNVRPGRDGAGVGQVGLRAPERRAARDHRRPHAHGGDVGPQGARLSFAAARSALAQARQVHL